MKLTLLAFCTAFSLSQELSAQEITSEEKAHSEHSKHASATHHPDQAKKDSKAITAAKSKIIAPVGNHSGMDHNAMPGMNHSQHANLDSQQGLPEENLIIDHTRHAMQNDSSEHLTQQREVSMQGGAAPEHARDPHAYSGGYGFGPLQPPVMADEENFAGLLVDRLESLSTGDKTFMTYDLQTWYGKNDNRALIRAEGDIDDGRFQNARSELLWAHAADANWDVHIGLRYDVGVGPDRPWLAVGVQGLAPYWIYTEATAYVGEQGRTAFRIETEYDILLTQKLILQPRVEANFYGKSDSARMLGHGLSDIVVGFRLHYEIRRELAPYFGIEWASKFGGTADYQRLSGNRIDETRAVAGIQFWY